MLILTKAILTMMIGFIISVIFGLILIPIFKRMKVKQKISVFLNKSHKKKDGIPTMGGIIFIIPTIITMFILLLLGKIQFTQNLLIVLFVFLAYALIGFIDDFLIIKKGKNEGLTEIQKLFGQLVVAIIFFIIFLKSGHETALNIHTLNIRIDMGWFYGLFLLFVLVASSNAVNLTDGLDGLAGGLSAFFLIPVICGLKEMLRYPINDYQISFAFNSKLKYFLNYVMPKIYIGSYNSNSILGRCGPIIYFGLFNLLLSYLYFFNKNIKRKEKILSLIIIIFFIMSFIIPGLQLFWQGFSFPNGFMDRYSFLLTFFLILLSVKQFYNYKNTKIMHIIIFLFMFLFLTIYVFEQNITLPYLNKQGILFTVIIMVLYLILYLYLFEYSKKKFFLIFLFFLTIIEIIISFNSLFIYQRYDISDYYKQSCKMFNTDNNTFYRIETVDYYNSFLDSFMCDFYSSKSTVSTNNAILHDFLLRNGGSLSYSHYMYDASVTPVLPSLLNVKYIYSINKLDTSYYNEIGYFYANNFVTEYKQKKINVYKNRFTLSVGFVIDDNYDKNYIKYNGTPFDNLNNLFYALSGENIQIFIPIDKEKIDELNYKYYIDRKTKYLFFSNNYEETIKVSSYTPVFVNDENIFVLNSLNIGMRKIKNDYYDENIVLSLDDNYLIKKFDLYYFDDKAFSKIIKKFKKNQLKKLKISGNRVSGNIDLNKNSTLFLSIPYNRGWQIYVDGKKVSYKKIADAFIGIEVPKGEHKISMKFYPKGIKLGIFISFVSIAVIIIFQRKGVYCA